MGRARFLAFAFAALTACAGPPAEDRLAESVSLGSGSGPGPVPGLCPNLSPGRPPTHAPISVRAAAGNLFHKWQDSKSCPTLTVGDPFASFLAELSEDRPVLMGLPNGFAGENPFTSSLGPILGIDVGPQQYLNCDQMTVGSDPGDGSAVDAPYAIYGNAGGLVTLPGIADAGVPEPWQLRWRIDQHREYMHEFDGISFIHNYVDFGTSMWARRSLPTSNGYGFWNFYAHHWNDYDFIIPGLEMGPQPPPLETWFLRDYDNIVDHAVPPALLPELQGFKFLWNPWKPSYGDLVRWATNITSEGWESYWPRLMRWSAYAGYKVQFVDNVGFGRCWNPECRTGFDTWLASRYSPAEIDRLFTVTTSLLADHSFEGGAWVIDAISEVWSTPNVYVFPGAYFPDEDSVFGLYSMRLAPDTTVWLHTDINGLSTALDMRNFQATLHYKGASLHFEVRVRKGQAEYVVECGQLPAAATWTPVSCELGQIAQGSVIEPKITSSGVAWIDELWVTDLDPATQQPSHPQYTTGIWEGDVYGDWNYPNRPLETVKYWDSLVEPHLGMLRDAGRSIEPDFDLYLNSGRQRGYAGYFMAERKTFEWEVYRDFDVGFPPGKYLPGGWHTPGPGMDQSFILDHEILATNIFDFAYLNARRFDDAFAYANYALGRPSPSENPSYKHNYNSALLQLSEVAAFGGGAAGDLALYVDGPYEPWEKLTYRKLTRDFFKFTAGHSELYECMESVARVALVVKDQDGPLVNGAIDISKKLDAAGIPFDVIAEYRFDPPDLAGYEVIILHEVKRLAADEATNLAGWVHNGGKLILSGTSVGQFDGLGRLWGAHPAPAWPFWKLHAAPYFQVEGTGAVLFLPAGIGDVGATIDSLLGYSPSMFPGLSAELAATMRGKVWTDHTNEIVHVLDYNVPIHPTPNPESPGPNDLLVRVPAAIFPIPDKAVIFYPPSEDTKIVGVTPGPNGTVEFTLPEHRIYSVALLFKSIGEIGVPVDCEIPNCIFDFRPWIWRVDPPWPESVLDALEEPAQQLALAGRQLALHRGVSALDVTGAISPELELVFASNAMFLSPVEADRDVPSAVQGVAVPRDGGDMFELVAAESGLDARWIGFSAEPAHRAVFSATERAIIVAGEEIQHFDLDRRKWTRIFEGQEPASVLALAYDANRRTLFVLDDLRDEVELLAYALDGGGVTRMFGVRADPARGKVALSFSGPNALMVSRETALGGWEAWSFDTQDGKWRAHAAGDEAPLDDPLASDRGPLLPVRDAEGLRFVELESELSEDGTGPEAL